MLYPQCWGSQTGLGLWQLPWQQSPRQDRGTPEGGDEISRSDKITSSASPKATKKDFKPEHPSPHSSWSASQTHLELEIGKGAPVMGRATLLMYGLQCFSALIQTPKRFFVSSLLPILTICKRLKGFFFSPLMPHLGCFSPASSETPTCGWIFMWVKLVFLLIPRNLSSSRWFITKSGLNWWQAWGQEGICAMDQTDMCHSFRATIFCFYP